MKIGEALTIKIATEAVVLRPTLRHAFELERRVGGIYGLGRALEEHSLDAACIIIRAHTQMPFLQNRVFDAGAEKLTPLLNNYLLALLGVDPFDPRYDEPAPRVTSKPKPYIEVLTQLFGIATGWLGWSPDDAWNASPMEIIAAYRGRQEMLRAIFGGADTERSEPQDLDGKVKAIFGKLETVKAA